MARAALPALLLLALACPAHAAPASAPPAATAPTAADPAITGMSPDAPPAVGVTSAAPEPPASDPAGLPAPAPDPEAGATGPGTAQPGGPDSGAPGATPPAPAEAGAGGAVAPGAEPPPPPALPLPANTARLAVSGLLGRTVNESNGKAIGRVVDVLVDAGGVPRAAVIDFGGFMGLGSRKIAVEWSAFAFPPGGSDAALTIVLSPEQIKNTPEYVGPGRPVAVVGPGTPVPRPGP